MKWKSEYLIGLDKIDAEHDEFLMLISNIESAIELQVESPIISLIVVDLKRFASSHFDSEETMMRAYRYKNLATHLRAHSHFIKKLDELADHTLNGLAGRKQLLNYLREWFVSHLNGPDREYADFVLKIDPMLGRAVA
jgi:hemerythrin